MKGMPMIIETNPTMNPVSTRMPSSRQKPLRTSETERPIAPKTLCCSRISTEGTRLNTGMR